MLRDTPKIAVAFENERLTVAPCGDIDHHSARIIREKIDALLYETRPKLLIIDLSGIDFMDSSGLGLILGRKNKASEIGTQTKLAGASVRIKKIFTLAGADKLIEFI